MATDVNAKLQALQEGISQYLYSDSMQDITMLVEGYHQTDPNNPSAGISGYTVTEHLDPSSWGALSHEVHSGNGNNYIEGDALGYAFVSNDTVPDGPDVPKKPYFVNVSEGRYKGPARSFNDIIYAGGGNDIINGKTGNDRLYGEAGDDFLIGGAGADELYGGTGDDVLVADTQDTHIDGGAGYDVLVVNGNMKAKVLNVEEIQGSAGDDSFKGTEAANTLYGGAGNDSILGEGGNDTLYGGDGADSLYGGIGDDQLFGGAGIDQISGDDGNDILFGEAGDDMLQGGLGNDTLYGGADDDQLFGGDGADVLQGGAGVDLLSGDDGNDILFGEAGDDVLQGGLGDDVLLGGAGADAMDGGEGTDRADYGVSSAAISVDLASGTGVGGDAQGDTLTNIEEVLGSAFGDTLAGDSNANTLYGMAGDDNMLGGAGNDTLYGGDGNDMMAGEGGVDFLVGGAGDDYYLFGSGYGYEVIVEEDGGGTDTAYFVGITGVNVYKQNNDLIIGANGNQDVMQFQNWYSSGSYTVEQFYFAASGQLFTADQIASYAVDITPSA